MDTNDINHIIPLNYDHYNIPYNTKYHYIWAYIAQDFDGIELINTEQILNSLNNEYDTISNIIETLFCSLDADSGCIWNINIIDNFNIIALIASTFFTKTWITWTEWIFYIA